MQTSPWLLVATVALTGTADGANAANAVFMASTSQCSSVDTCYEGGASSTPCTVSSGGCPPCITFADDGCYVKVGDSCPFGVDCSSVWGSSTSTSSGSSTSTTTSSTTGSTTTSTTTSSSTGSSTPTTAGTSSQTGSTTDTSGTAGVSSSSSTVSSTSGSSSAAAGDSSSGGSDMSVVFAIIGAAIGVIAVAVIFLTLVRRSKAASEDEDDEMPNATPAFAKSQGPHSTTGAAMYASYNGNNRAGGVGSGTGNEIGLDMSKGVSMNAMSYYNQQPPQNSTAPSPRVAGRAIPSQPVGMNQSAGVARPYGGSQNFGASGVGVTSGMGVSGVVVVNQAPPAPMQHHPMGGVAPSPHTRRESYEF
ncbi:hypothetical protein PC129_g11272 [Phytophthora cactorum]|uniref:Carbohydrate-binding protein n=1 Tax=Phytophthora cactorum TaxID=29920 RepID=A0A329S3V2_9STRA|nr:hypothetical protein Pcac1_g15608 [Phytophthora cactorum]KAG2817604.1 hypothetical protein PC112_g12992 [Phytophthora cactorum]KAG2823136.1 hypothetical protein PC111_g10364 [Phytophthora cactorum]KAG2854289.1 hypothetical protein PC113_g13446 [Phytophthora cactorum]KAG2899422.1 hypothetical protein PC114_g13973 [Phytophthora cactorum]